MGGDRTWTNAAYIFRVSIHAPAWGATISPVIKSYTVMSFNPRPRMGGDETRCVNITIIIGFNPRPRMGGDI